jgi:hypothetical protein
MNPRTLASGIKAISAVLNPPKVTNAAKADTVLDEWEDKLVKLSSEYSQALTNKMKVAVLYAMLPKELQEKVLDACTVAWDGTNEGDAGVLFQKVKGQVKNIAKARREMQGPKPMEVDKVTASWADWAEDEWSWYEDVKDEATGEESYVQYIGGDKGGKAKGKGFQGHCYTCGEFGHSQRDCAKGGKGKGGKGGNYAKGYGKDGFKGYGKDGAKGYGKDGFKGYGGWYGKGGKGPEHGKGGATTMPRACFGCGATDHIIRDCPKNPMKVQTVEQEKEEILFIGNVQEDWRHIPMKVKIDGKKERPGRIDFHPKISNRFRVLQEDELDEEDVVCFCRAVSVEECMKDQANIKDRRKLMAKQVSWVQAVECMKDRANVEDHLKLIAEQVSWVQAVNQQNTMTDLGVGDIVIDSAADESCWPVGQGDAYPTKQSSRQLKLRTANGGEMTHYGEKEVFVKYKGGEAKDPIGMKFQVTDVRKPLLAVRRLVERGNTVVLSESESYIENKAAKIKIPLVKKGGSFVLEARFVMNVAGFARQV